MKKLILFCLMLISGLTQAQEFDFSCEEFVYTYNVIIGSGNHEHTLTASKTISNGNMSSFDLNFAIPDGYLITSGTNAQTPHVKLSSGWSVRRGAIVEGADSFKVNVKPPSVLIDGNDEVDFGTWITVGEFTFNYEMSIGQWGYESTMTASKTIYGSDFSDTMSLSGIIPKNYYVENTKSNFGPILYNGGFSVQLHDLIQEDDVNMTITLPDDIPWNTSVAFTTSLNPWIYGIDPPKVFNATINSETVSVTVGEPENFVMTDPAEENFTGTMEIVVEGPNFPSKTFMIDYPGGVTTYLEGTPFHIQIPIQIPGAVVPSNEHQWVLGILIQSESQHGEWTATYSQVDSDDVQIPGVDFVIDAVQYGSIPSYQASSVLITWELPGEDPAYQVVDVSTGNVNFTFKGKFELPEGITTKDIEGLNFHSGDYTLELEAADELIPSTNVEWKLKTKGGTSSKQIAVELYSELVVWEWFHGYYPYEISDNTEGNTKFDVTWVLGEAGNDVYETIEFLAGPSQHDFTDLIIDDEYSVDFIDYNIPISDSGATLHVKASADGDVKAYITVDSNFDTSNSKNYSFVLDLSSLISSAG